MKYDGVDRVAPTLRPDATAIMRQDWHHLLFLHWEIPEEKLRPLVPPELDIDTWEGKAYVTVVPFTVTGARPSFTPPLPFLSSFLEVNVRTYVLHRGGHPGVWFFSLDASNPVVVAAARAAFHLDYTNAHIEFATDDKEERFAFHSSRSDTTTPASCTIEYSASGAVQPALAGTLEHFLLERYILYARDGERQLYRGRIHHAPYPAQKGEIHRLEETLVWAAGLKRAEVAPIAQYAREVNVEIFALDRVE